MHNSSQSDSSLLADHIYTKIIIVLVIGTDFFRHQYDMVVQPARRSQE